MVQFRFSNPTFESDQLFSSNFSLSGEEKVSNKRLRKNDPSLAASDRAAIHFLQVVVTYRRTGNLHFTSKTDTNKWLQNTLMKANELAKPNCWTVLSSPTRSNSKYRGISSGWCSNTMSDQAWQRSGLATILLLLFMLGTRSARPRKLEFARNSMRSPNQPPPLNCLT